MFLLITQLFTIYLIHLNVLCDLTICIYYINRTNVIRNSDKFDFNSQRYSNLLRVQIKMK